MSARGFLAGAAAAVAGRALLPRLLKLKFDRDVARLNAGDYAPLLRSYHDDVVLRFAPGDHRWAGSWIGKRELDAFFQNFVGARVQGTIRQIVCSGPPWALVMWVLFDDHADAADGTRLYDNRTVLVLRTRWGKVVEQEDFYVDTVRMLEFDRALAERGIAPVPRPPVS